MEAKAFTPKKPGVDAKHKTTAHNPVYLSADQIGYDSTNGTVVAVGKVEVVQGDYILLADRLTYYQDQDIVQATGHVSLLEPDSNVLFSNNMRLQQDMQKGIIENFRVRMSDNSLFAAREARKRDDRHYELRKAVYSPCKLCRDEKTGLPSGDPLWQLKADRVTIDEDKQSVVYHNAFMEVYGVPVLYTPYFTHPTPDADRKTGVLIPVYSQSSQLGTTLRLPVYINIAPDKDATLTPFLTTKEGEVLLGQYRQITDKGYYQFDGSLTDPRKLNDAGNEVAGRELRGNIFAHGGSQFGQNWDWGFDVNRATDDTYLRRYKLGNQDTLTSRLFTEMIDKRDYVNIQGLAFQGLRATDDADTTPRVLPDMQAHIESKPMVLGSRFSLDASGRAVERDIGSESRRATLQTGYKIPYVLPGGQVLEANASIRQDVYSLSDTVIAGTGNKAESTVGRTIPQAALTWRYPLIRYVDKASLTIEPTVELVASSNGNNPASIPNEDSLTPELSDLNLFSTQRYPGFDRVENGTRGIYGVRGDYATGDGKNFNAMLGQDIQLIGDRSFPVSDHAGESVSDYVGRIGAQTPHYEAEYRFRLDSENYKLNQDEVHASINYQPVSFSADYLKVLNDPTTKDREEGLLAGNYKIDNNWTVNAFGRRDLNEDAMIAAGGGITFANECVTVVTRLDREYVRDRDVQPDTSFSVRLFLKNLTGKPH